MAVLYMYLSSIGASCDFVPAKPKLRCTEGLDDGDGVHETRLSDQAGEHPEVLPVHWVSDLSEPLTVKQVMRYAMTQGLCQKVIQGKASEEEQTRLVALLERLTELEPPLGTGDAWRLRTERLLTAAREVAAGESSHPALAAAANCTACHKEHRPK